MLKAYPNNRGYMRVFLPTDDGKTSRQIHRLVAQAYIPNPEGLPVVNHKDGDKHNNDVSNLEWVTYQENSQHALTLGKRERKPVARVNPKKGKVRDVFMSINQAAKYRGVSYASLYDAIKHQYTYRGDLWVYCELKVEV